MPEENNCLFGKAAIEAVRLVVEEKRTPSKEVWEEAVSKYSNAASCREKPCPRNTFIGLCEAGMIKDIGEGGYYRAIAVKFNKKYAIKAVKILRDDPALLNDKNVLWKKVIDKKPNNQMDVVLALCDAGLIVDCCDK